MASNTSSKLVPRAASTSRIVSVPTVESPFTVPAAIPYALFIAGGLAFSIPLAIATTMPAAGPAMVQIGLCQLPEETAPPGELTALALPAIEAARRRKA